MSALTHLGTFQAPQAEHTETLVDLNIMQAPNGAWHLYTTSLSEERITIWDLGAGAISHQSTQSLPEAMLSNSFEVEVLSLGGADYWMPLIAPNGQLLTLSLIHI